MKQQTRNRNRRMTRAQKQTAVLAGVDPTQYLFAGENEFYLFLVHKHTNTRTNGSPSPKSASEKCPVRC